MGAWAARKLRTANPKWIVGGFLIGMAIAFWLRKANNQ